ncbi:hypothetical protein J6590_006645 [Homalodisca vitripennis]|nr:hypothetical protein J6590_006645 [Homalodisca vitripennis]
MFSCISISQDFLEDIRVFLSVLRQMVVTQRTHGPRLTDSPLCRSGSRCGRGHVVLPTWSLLGMGTAREVCRYPLESEPDTLKQWWSKQSQESEERLPTETRAWCRHLATIRLICDRSRAKQNDQLSLPEPYRATSTRGSFSCLRPLTRCQIFCPRVY